MKKENKVTLSTYNEEYGEYQWKNYEQVHADIHSLSKYIYKEDLSPVESFDSGEFRFMALYSKNREEWCTTDLACAFLGVTVVTLYDTLGVASIDYILNQTKMQSVTLTSDKVKVILKLKQEGKLEHVKNLLVIDPISAEDQAQADSNGVKIHQFDQAIKTGTAISDSDADYAKERPLTGETVYTFSYTSGTTGMPKGAMLSNKNFTANIGSMPIFDGGQLTIRNDDIYISYLPLAHVFERFMYLAVIAFNGQYGFY